MILVLEGNIEVQLYKTFFFLIKITYKNLRQKRPDHRVPAPRQVNGQQSGQTFHMNQRHHGQQGCRHPCLHRLIRRFCSPAPLFFWEYHQLPSPPFSNHALRMGVISVPWPWRWACDPSLATWNTAISAPTQACPL